VRALLLALAVIDDLIAIVIIAIFFTTDAAPLALIAAVPVILAFGWLSRSAGGRNRVVVGAALVVLGLGAWVLVFLAGVHPTIAGVALGLVFASRSSEAVRHAIEPWSNAVILPVFAFVATLVVIPDLTTTPLGIVFWAIVLALPVGKLIGITAGALIASRLGGGERIPVRDVLVVAALGGIGFTVSLLMNELAFQDSPAHATEGTLGVLVASVVAVIVGGIVGALRSRQYARR
jgi:NhaA family Na+:H+ antiporter